MRRGITVYITDDNWERGLRKFKKKVADSRLLQDLREREHYTKPTTKRKMAHNAAKNRWQKYLSTQKLPKNLF